MSDLKKGEYVAVPTSDVDQEAALPAYSKEETTEVIAVDDTQKRRRRRLRFMLIGGAVALLGLTHLCSGPMQRYAESRQLDLYSEHTPEPCSIRHSEQFSELKHHMDYLTEALGDKEDHWQPMEHPEDKPHHGKHHHGKHHHGKHKHDQDKTVQEDSESADNVRKVEGHHRMHTGELAHNFDEEHRHHHPTHFCRTQDLESTSTVLKFSPEDFSSADVLSKSFFSPGSRIRVLQNEDESVKDVHVNVTVYSGRKELEKQVQISAFDHNGIYTVQVEREHKRRFPFPPHRKHEDDDEEEELAFEEVPEDGDHPPHDGPHHPPHDRPHHPPHEKKEDCLYYEVDVVFPQSIDYFEKLGLESKHAFIRGGKGVNNIEFGVVKAGVKEGAIIFRDLKAKKLLFGVLNGVVMGRYEPSESFTAGAVRGAVKVKVEPTGENINITAASTFGPVSVDVPADKYKGDFTLFNLFGEPSSIQAPNPEDIHVTKFKHHVKSGYYKEEHTGSRIIVDAKLHGGETLTFY